MQFVMQVRWFVSIHGKNLYLVSFHKFFIFLQKLGLSIGIAASGFMLDFAGYITPENIATATQPENVQFLLRLFVSIIPAITLALSIPIVMAYPITKERFVQIQKDLAERKNSE